MKKTIFALIAVFTLTFTSYPIGGEEKEPAKNKIEVFLGSCTTGSISEPWNYKKYVEQADGTWKMYIWQSFPSGHWIYSGYFTRQPPCADIGA